MKLNVQRELWLSFLILLGSVFTPGVARSADFVRGDANIDSSSNVSDAAFVLGYLFSGSPASLGCEDAADANDSGTVDIADPVYLLSFLFSGGSDLPPPLTCGGDPTPDGIGCDTFPICPSTSAASLVRTSPGRGERGVALTRETILYFSAPVDASSLPERSETAGDPIFARQGGRVLPARLNVSSDGQTVTLFYDVHLPASARVRVTVDGGAFLDAAGAPVDVDSNGRPGGLFTLDFDTITVTTLPGTVVVGRVFASELAAMPGGETVNTALEGVVITVDGAEDVLRAVTDAMGNFRLDPAPVGGFFVHIDGRPVTGQFPDGDYYPFLGKPWTSVAGREASIGDIFLPLIRAGSLQPVRATAETRVSFPDEVLAEHPELEGAMLMVPPDSLYSDDGTRGGKVGIAPVPPDRLPGELPDGLEFPLVITVQSDGGTNFDTPAGLCLPNLPDPVTGERQPPGARDSLYSFNHDSGRWEAVGAVVVSDDGTMVCTEPGVGILAPGWHGVGPDPWEPPPPPPDCEGGGGDGRGGEACEDGCDQEGLEKNIKRCEQDYGIEVTLTIVGTVLCVFVSGGSGLIPCIVAGYLAGGAATFKFALCNDRALEDSGCAGAGAGAGLPSLDPLVVEIDALVSEGVQLVLPHALAGESVPPDVQQQLDALLLEADRIAGGDALGLLLGRVLELEAERKVLEDGVGEAAGNAPPYPVMYAATVHRSSKGDTHVLELRGETLAYGQYSLFVPRDGTLLQVTFYDPIAKAWGVVHPRVTPDVPYRLPRLYLQPVDDTFPDFDSDGLADAVELVYGTKPGDPDTDGDGIPDGAEIDQGTNPLDGLTATTGIIGTAATAVIARDVRASGDLVVVAGLKKDSTGEPASAVVGFNVFGGMEPRIVFQVDLPGTATAVNLSVETVEIAHDGLTFIDTTNMSSVNVRMAGPEWGQLVIDPGAGLAQAIATAGGVAFAGTSTGIVAMVDLPTGMPLELLQLTGRGGIEDLAIEGDTLYAYTERELVVVSLLNPDLLNPDLLNPDRERKGVGKDTFTYTFWDVLGSVDLPGSVNRRVHGRGRLFVGNGIAYATHSQGYHTIGVGNPAFPGTPENPAIIAEGETAQRGWKQIVLNGSGLGVATVGPNSTAAGPHHVSLYDVSDLTKTDVFLTQFETPGIAQGVFIERGLAYVADGIGGLLVINHLAYDANGVPPSVSVGTVSGAATIEEGHGFTVSARVEDDVEAREVAFFVDGVEVARDGSFPFEARLRAPLLSQTDSIRIEARATDTGGNTGVSEELVLTVTPDNTPPGVARIWPPAGSTSPVEAVGRVAVRFTEAIMPATVTSVGFYYITPDGNLFEWESRSSYSEDTYLVVLDLAEPLPEGDYRIVVRTSVSDLAGNPMESEVTSTFAVFLYDFTQDSDELLSFVGEGEVDMSYPHGYSFLVNAGQRLFFDEQSNEVSVSWICLPEADDEVLFESNAMRDGTDVGRVVLEQGGLYTLQITGTGAYRFKVWEAPPVEEFEIALGDKVSEGVPGSGAGVIETPGAEDVYRFTARAGERVYFDEQAGCCNVDWRCVDEDGTEIFSSNSISDPADIGTLTLLRGGIYTITVLGRGDGVGAYGFQLWDVPAEHEFGIAIGDSASGVIEVPGAENIYTFSAAAGETVFFDEEAACCKVAWRCVDEAGAEVFGPNSINSAADVGLVTLERGGVYTITVSGVGDGTGAYTFRLWDVPPPERFEIAIGDTVSGELQTPGAEDIYSFSAAAGEKVFFDEEAICCRVTWRCVDEAGAEVFGPNSISSAADVGAVTLERGGAYTITVSSIRDGTGPYGFEVRTGAE